MKSGGKRSRNVIESEKSAASAAVEVEKAAVNMGEAEEVTAEGVTVEALGAVTERPDEGLNRKKRLEQ